MIEVRVLQAEAEIETTSTHHLASRTAVLLCLGEVDAMSIQSFVYSNKAPALHPGSRTCVLCLLDDDYDAESDLIHAAVVGKWCNIGNIYSCLDIPQE